MSKFDAIINMYGNAPINAIYKPVLSIEKEGTASIKYTVNDDHFHAGGYLHGSAIFKLLDDAAFFAAQSLEPRYFVVTASYNANFIRPINEGILVGYGTVIESTKTQIFADSVIKNEDGKLIAKGSGIFMKSTIDLASLNLDPPKIESIK